MAPSLLHIIAAARSVAAHRQGHVSVSPLLLLTLLLNTGNTTGINFSEKALHWCDAARPAVAELMLNGVLTNTSSSPTIDGWYGPTAMATLSLYGAVNSSCYGDAVGVQSPLTQLGVMGGTCSSVLASCSRLKGFRYVDLTPQSNLTGFTPVLEHLQTHHAVAARLQVGVYVCERKMVW